MSPLINTIVNGTSQLWEAQVWIGATLAAMAIRMAPGDSTKRRPEKLDSRTLSDIGIERGSITWLS